MDQVVTGLLRQFVALAARIGVVAPGVGRGVARKLPLGRVPLELSAPQFLAVQVRNVAEVADRHAARADLDRAVRLPPGNDAVDPILPMARVTVAGHLVEVDLIFSDRLLDDAFRLAAEFAAVDEQFAVGADEGHTGRATVNHLDAVGVDDT